MELQAQNLRIGNLVHVLGRTRVVKSVDRFGISYEIENALERLMAFKNGNIKPIPLTEEWLIKMKDAKYKGAFPDWIKYVHEAQNWYYWNYGKTELTINN